MGRRSCHWMARKMGGELSLEDQDTDGEEKLSLDGQEAGGGGGGLPGC